MTEVELQECYARIVASYEACESVVVSKSLDEINALYSADKLTEGKARGLVRAADGKTYVVTGAAHITGKRFIFGHPCIPLAAREAHHPKAVTHSERCAAGIYGEHFYDGVMFKCRGTTWLMLEGEVRFVEDAPPAARQQLELF